MSAWLDYLGSWPWWSWVIAGAALLAVIGEWRYRRWYAQARNYHREYDRRGTPVGDRFRSKASMQTGIPDPPPNLPKVGKSGKIARRFSFKPKR